MELFHSAALRLTVWYLAIIMALSLILSGVIYQFANAELQNNTRRQVYFFNDQLSPSDFLTFSRLRQQQLDEGIRRLKINMVLFNLIVLACGGGASYWLARRTMQPIEDALEAQTRFAGDASHELRTPLAAMQSEIEVALRNPSLTKSEAIELLGSNLEEATKLKALSDGLLRLTSTDNNQSLNEIVRLKTVVEQAIEQWTKVAKTKNIKLKSDLSDVKSRGDHQSLVDLVSILLDNGIKYSPKGSEIDIKLFKKDRSACVSIQDFGRGIDRDDLPRIFDRFYRADSSRDKSQVPGYGLGLAIAKKIADLHKASIEVRSTPAKGSIFTIKLPAI